MQQQKKPTRARNNYQLPAIHNSMDSFEDSQEYRDLRRQDNKRNERSLPDSECRHELWSQKCGLCGRIMGSDCQTNCKTGDYHKEIYHEFESLVCSFSLARKLQEAKLVQRSKLYWVLHANSDILTLRAKENATLIGTTVAAAYTSSELCKHLYRLPRTMLTEEIYIYIGKNSNDPNRLARLLLKEKKRIIELRNENSI